MRHHGHRWWGRGASSVMMMVRACLLAAEVAAHPRHWVRTGMAGLVLMSWMMGNAAFARDIHVANAADFHAARDTIRPGDAVVMADGEWRDADLRLDARGTENRPITLRPQTPGGVIITGRSTLRIAGSHLIVRDLVFRDGQPLEEAAIVTRIGARWTEQLRLTGLLIHRFSNAGRRTEDHWIALYGRDIRLDHSHVEGKQNAGATLVVMRGDGWPLDNRVRIEHNYFGPRPPLGSNGGETIRVGTSENSLTDSRSVIAANIFDRCSGEVEIVSIKSGGNIIRGNLFLRSQGSLVLRHGNGNLVEANIFMGHGAPNTGGIRVINRGQIIRNNYMEGLTGRVFAGSLAIMNGVPNSAINRYHQVTGATIANNSIIHPRSLSFGTGASDERSLAPDNVRFVRNLLVPQPGSDPLEILSATTGFRFDGNLSNAPIGAATAFAHRPLALVRAANGLLYPADPHLRRIGAPATLHVPQREDVGPLWVNAQPSPPTNASRMIAVATADQLVAALANANDGDVIDLASNGIMVTAPLTVARDITITGSGARLGWRSATLFQLVEGGSLRLRGLTVAGGQAPARPGNAMIRTPGGSMLSNYVIDIENCTIEALNSGPGFDVITTTPGTLAAIIRIARSSLSDISGALIAGASERGPVGVYAAEVIELDALAITRVRMLADILRDGTDESTFGPRFTLVNSRIADSGPVRLSGVQHSLISRNRFARSDAMHITHSVGEPLTEISGNILEDTPAPVVTELYYRGPPRVIVNTVEQP